MDPRIIYQNSEAASMAYMNCKTAIIDLRPLDLPEAARENQYKEIFDQHARKRTRNADLLTDAINSVRYGIAPPVAFPTETVYGLGADATNTASIAGIFAAKGRPSDNPLIVHFSSRDHLERFTGEPLPTIYDNLVQKFWPGPLTVLVPVPKKSIFADNVHPGQRTIGVRVPQSKYARFFIAATGRPIAAPSANSSGKPSPTTAQHVMDDLKGKINFILDGGSCDVGIESTVVDGLCDPPLILRPGGISQNELIMHGKRHGNRWAQTAIAYKQSHTNPHQVKDNMVGCSDSAAPRAPGMKYKHYSPRGKLILFEDHQTYERLHDHIDYIIDDRTSTKHSEEEAIINGDKKASAETRKPCIAILTSTLWPPFAGLPLYSTDDTKLATNGSTTDSNDLNLYNHQHSAPPSPSKLLQRPPQPSARNRIEFSTGIYRNTKIHTIDLGKAPKKIAHSLFAALRKCDDLNCTHILAEAPARPIFFSSTSSASSFSSTAQIDNRASDVRTSDGITVDTLNYEDTATAEIEKQDQMDHAYEAVIERMRKAASLIL